MNQFLMLSFSLFFSFSLFAAPKVSAPAPDFQLQGHDGKMHKLSDFKGKFVVMEWWNKDCPFVRKHYDSGNMQNLQKAMTSKDVVWLTVLSSAPNKQGYLKASEIGKVMAKEKASPSVVLVDPDGKVGKMYAAKTTPHMYVVNPKGELVYKGAIDDKPSTNPDDIKNAKNYVKLAMNAAMAGKPVAEASTKPYGCSVKY